MNETEKQNSRSWQSVCDDFYSTQQANYQETPCPLPSMRLPVWQRALFFRLSADSMAFNEAEMDVTQDMEYLFAERGRTDVRMKVYVFRIPVCGKGCFRVVSAFLSVDEGRLVDDDDVALVREYIEKKYELFRREEGLSTLHYYYVIGSERPFDGRCQALARPTVVLCHPLESGLWDFRLPRGEIDRATGEFLLHILPGARESYADAMAAEIERWDQTNYVTPEALRERLGLDTSVYIYFLSRWLDALFAHGGYGRDSRGYVYGRNMTLPPGKGARRCRRYDSTRRSRTKLNALSVAAMAGMLAMYGMWVYRGNSGDAVWWGLAWGLLALTGVLCQWKAWHLENRCIR